jgi:ATP-binding cassette, subfamily F, member 3
VEKPLRALSGGERTRFRLAQMLFSPANVLLLDEPTNHLDVTSRATVEEALRSYTGTVIVVSHDRVFMNRVTNRIIEIENGDVHTYPGTYDDYLHHKEMLSAEDAPPDEEQETNWGSPLLSVDVAPPPDNESRLGLRRLSNPEPDKKAIPSVPLNKEERKREREQRKEQARRQRKIETRVKTLEAEIARHEERLEEIDRLMADPAVATDYGRIEPLTAERHDAALAEWEALHESIEKDAPSA